MRRRQFRWWHGLLFYAGVQAVSFGLNACAKAFARRRGRGEERDEKELYRRSRLPVFAPPTVAFPIAWSINSFSTIAGALHVLNLAPETAGRAEFLGWQAGAWALYSTFQAGYFGSRSPINAELITLLYTAATIASLDLAVRKMNDGKAAASLTTTVAWLALANPVGLASAAWNYDPFWRIGPLMEPKAEWVKTAS